MTEPSRREPTIKERWRVMILKWKMMREPEGRPLRKVIMIESKHLRSLILTGLFAQISLMTFVFVSDHQGRADNEKYQLESCNRATKGATASATFSQAVLDAFEDTDRVVPEPNTPTRDEAEAKIQKAINAYVERTRLRCRDEVPRTKILP